MAAVDLSDIADIYGIIHVPWWQLPIVKVLLFIGVGGPILLGLFMVFKKLVFRKKNLPTWIEAQERLTALKSSALFNELSARQFYSQLTAILKRYMADRYGYDIAGKTDDEIILLLDQQVEFPRDLIPLLYDILSHAASVKFANVPGLIKQMESDLVASGRLVAQTTPSSVK